MAETEFTRSIRCFPAYDNTDRKNGGRGAMKMFFVLRGPLGAITFAISTGWWPRELRERLSADLPRQSAIYILNPSGQDVGRHWTTPLYPTEDGDEWEPFTHEGCDFLDGHQFCHYDGSGLAADALLESMITQGDEVVWAELEAVYHYVAGDIVVTPEDFERAKLDTQELATEFQRPLEEKP